MTKEKETPKLGGVMKKSGKKALSGFVI